MNVYFNEEKNTQLGSTSHSSPYSSSVNISAMDDGFSEEVYRNGKTRPGHTRIQSADYRKSMKAEYPSVVVRYFLDRPGYGLHNSAARLWFNPPPVVTPTDLEEFLVRHGIALPGLLIEVYLDKFGSFMLLEACAHSLIEWDFSESSHREPGILNIRLTDLMSLDSEPAQQGQVPAQPQPQQKSADSEIANITPVGLFAFSLMVGMETVDLMSRMFPDFIDPSFVLVWGPYMFFVGGTLQFTTGFFQVYRNNLYGAVVFLVFSTLWLANGATSILKVYFAHEGTKAYELLDSTDPAGFFFRQFYTIAFVCVVLKQTFVMNKLSTTLISLVCLKVAAASLTGWIEDMEYVQMVLGIMTSIFAYYVFMVEFTNQIYHREVFPVWKWSDKNSPEEAFGAAGRLGTLQCKAARLRQAAHPNVRMVREATQEKLEDAEYVKKES